MAKTVITTPFPSAAYITEKLGLPRSRIERLERLIAEIQGEGGREHVSAAKRRLAAPAAKRRFSGAARRRAVAAAKRRFSTAASRRAAAAAKRRVSLAGKSSA